MATTTKPRRKAKFTSKERRAMKDALPEAKKAFSGKRQAGSRAGTRTKRAKNLEGRDAVNPRVERGKDGANYSVDTTDENKPVRTKIRESGAERIAREASEAREGAMERRVRAAVDQVKSGKLKLADVPESIRAQVKELAGIKDAKPAPKPKAPKDSGKTKQLQEVKDWRAERDGHVKTRMKQLEADGAKAQRRNPPTGAPDRNLPPRASVSQPAQSSRVRGETRVDPNTGSFIDRKNLRIVNPKTGAINLDRAKANLERGLITQKEYDEFVKQKQLKNDARLARTSVARKRAEAGKAKTRAELEKWNAYVEKHGKGGKPKAAAPAGRAATPTTVTATEAPGGRVRPIVNPKKGTVNLKALDDALARGLITQKEYDQQKMRIRQPAAKAPAAKKPATGAAKGTVKIQLPKAAADFGSSPEGRKAIEDYKAGKISRAELGAKARAWSGAKSGAKAAKPGTALVPRAASAVEKVAGKAGKLARFVRVASGTPGVGTALTAITEVSTDPTGKKRLSRMEDWLKKHPNASGLDRVKAQGKNMFLGNPFFMDKYDTEKAPLTKRGKSEDRGSSSRAPKAVFTQKPADRNKSVGQNAKRKALISQKSSNSGGASKGTYTVKRGDTLWGIAKANGTTVDALLKANPVLAERGKAGKTRIFSGTKVRIK